MKDKSKIHVFDDRISIEFRLRALEKALLGADDSVTDAEYKAGLTPVPARDTCTCGVARVFLVDRIHLNGCPEHARA